MVRIHVGEVEVSLNELLLKILDLERRDQIEGKPCSPLQVFDDRFPYRKELALLELRNNAEHIFLFRTGGISGPSCGGTGGDHHQERYKAYAYLMAAHLNHTEIIAYFTAVRLKRRPAGSYSVQPTVVRVPKYPVYPGTGDCGHGMFRKSAAYSALFRNYSGAQVSHER